MSGGEDTDARITAFRLWYTDADAPGIPASWYDDATQRDPLSLGWRPLCPLAVTSVDIGWQPPLSRAPRPPRAQKQRRTTQHSRPPHPARPDPGGPAAAAPRAEAAVFNGRVFAAGTSTLSLAVPPTRASALLLKVDGVRNVAVHAAPARTHLPEDPGAGLVEFAALARAPAGAAPAPAAGEAGEWCEGAPAPAGADWADRGEEAVGEGRKAHASGCAAARGAPVDWMVPGMDVAAVLRRAGGGLGGGGWSWRFPDAAGAASERAGGPCAPDAEWRPRAAA